MKVYKVGGAVRDSLLGVDASDNDWVVIGSSPEEMISKGYKPIGKDFPVFLHPETKEEYALARTERKSGTGYHGFTFYYGKDVTIEEDLLRRDFTINAIAQDEDGNIIDPHNGIDDLEQKIFRHVSDAFHEDPLRAIRLARFYSYAHLSDFKISESTVEHVEKIVESNELSELLPDRVWAEVSKSLDNKNPNKFFEKIISLNLKSPFFENLNSAVCDTHPNKLIRWCELQINNSFLLGQSLPIPKKLQHSSNCLRSLSMISRGKDKSELLSLIYAIDFKANSELIKELKVLPNLIESLEYISKLEKKINEADFSILAKFSKEKVKEEKDKIYKDIISQL